MKHRKIIFVCTGNTCRSPMAEAAMKAELKRRKIRWYTVQSAGLQAAEGSPISAFAAQALSEAKIPCAAAFASRRLTREMLDGAYAVVCMTESQRRQIGDLPNVTSFYEIAGSEIPDPYGRGIDVYRATLRAIRECLPLVIRRICPPFDAE